ncbi:hypothetical protein [Vibrio metschnikovii]|uniref:Uncharacterized protein n=1 Tax=bacterium 19PA01SH03 TaxID=2920705 RepID=A0AAU6SNJ5_UNCXX
MYRKNQIFSNYIDVIGPSGSGKSTLINGLKKLENIVTQEDLKQRIVSLSNEDLIIAFMDRYPNFKIKVQRLFHRHPQARTWILGLIINYMKVTEGELVIIDEGFVCRLNTIYSYLKSPIKKKVIYAYLDVIPKPSFVVMIKPNCIDNLLLRMEKRESGLPHRMRELNLSERKLVIKKQMKILEHVEAYCRENMINTIVLDSEASLEEHLSLTVANFNREKI